MSRPVRRLLLHRRLVPIRVAWLEEQLKLRLVVRDAGGL
ncbi:hypothetical protein D187_009960 [Cystobacter fuscus DSM 2262]|uniref:Uncharacterized protein n=1 Tax=Cystobacter fuscus (strain ATCC 25194 / DSM 2262 / NBRC 100088 / M29) TaxID=1242864 RepID=S9PI41_CYSF2|nr:hypothetical protein D187_009960 [Cystobacter fuscus DSM 2262]